MIHMYKQKLTTFFQKTLDLRNPEKFYKEFLVIYDKNYLS